MTSATATKSASSTLQHTAAASTTAKAAQSTTRAAQTSTKADQTSTKVPQTPTTALQSSTALGSSSRTAVAAATSTKAPQSTSVAGSSSRTAPATTRAPRTTPPTPSPPSTTKPTSTEARGTSTPARSTSRTVLFTSGTATGTAARSTTKAAASSSSRTVSRSETATRSNTAAASTSSASRTASRSDAAASSTSRTGTANGTLSPRTSSSTGTASRTASTTSKAASGTVSRTATLPASTTKNTPRTTTHAVAAEQWVMGYYVAYQASKMPPESISWSGMSHIVMGRVKANSDGTLNTDFDYDPTSGPALAKDVASRAHAAGKKAILMLGGDDNSPKIADAVRDHSAAFVANLATAVQSYGYDGLDLDWENTIDYDQFVAFVADLRTAMPDAILTVPIGTQNINYDVVPPRLPDIASMVDRLSVMSYFPATSWAGSGWLSWFNCPLHGAKPATPVSIDDTLARYVAAGIPREKLAMGIAFYVTCYTGGITAPDQGTETGVEIKGGDNDFMLSDLFGTDGAYDERYRKWYATAGQPYLSLPVPERHGCKYVTYEDEESILVKGKFSRDQGYGGIIIWTINQGNVASHSNPGFLLDALGKGFLNTSMATLVAVSVMQGNIWVHTGATQQFTALVTGSTNRNVTWSVVEATCGSITTNGSYTAPASEKNCTIRATSTADASKSATALVTVNNTPWTPVLTVTRPGMQWVEVVAHDTTVNGITVFFADGTSAALFLHMVLWGTNFPDYVANMAFPQAGGSYAFLVRSTTGRTFNTTLVIPACVHNGDGYCVQQ
ncbi:glycoside hydrolase superfamily [Hyaloraphidium curvatum]|nr:glycoside hydrolase superfamily [Hyaloraphidium curvatum]